MANQIQMVMYEGYIAGKPDMQYTPKGTPVTNFSMGSNRSFKNAEGETVKETTWLKISAWGKLAEIVNQYCDKGVHVIVTGRLRGKNGSPEVFERKDGGHGANFELVASEIRILNSKSEDSSGAASVEQPAEDDLPF